MTALRGSDRLHVEPGILSNPMVRLHQRNTLELMWVGPRPRMKMSYFAWGAAFYIGTIQGRQIRAYPRGLLIIITTTILNDDGMIAVAITIIPPSYSSAAADRPGSAGGGGGGGGASAGSRGASVASRLLQ